MRLSQVTLLALLEQENPTRQMLASIPRENWAITSFDPNTNKACVRIDNGKRTVILDVFVPDVIVKIKS